MGRATAALGLARIAVVMSALSLLVSLVGVTPADAVRAVARALNADKVSGIGASRTPRPGKLLPLGADSRFPSSVLPPAPRGPRGAGGPTGAPGNAGAEGAQGAQGPAGLSVVRVTNGASIYLPQAAGSTVQVARLDNLPAGAWLLAWSATLDHGSAQTISVHCSLRIGQNAVADADASVGTSAGAQYADELGSFGATTQSQTFSVQLMCGPGTASSDPVHLDSQRIVAIRADALEVTG